jgi:hypothetical protein
MKKIVGIIAAVAMATSVFAADVSAKVNLLGSVFNWKQDGNLHVLGIAEGGQGWNPSFAMTVSGDKAGASMKFNDPEAAGAVSNVNYNLWFKPIDALKIQVGQWDTNLNQEKIDWSNTATGIDKNGVALCLNTNGFELDAFFVTGWSGGNFGWNRNDNVKGWINKTGDADAVIGETYIKAAYGADFGSISAYADLKTAEKDGPSWAGGTDAAYEGMDFGFGYANTFGSVNTFFNGIVGFGPKGTDKNQFGIFRGEAYVSTNIDAFGISAFIVGGFKQKDVITNIAQDKLANVQLAYDGAFVGFTAKFTYGINGYTPYLYLKEDNFMKDGDFAMEIKPGVTFNVGTCALDIALDIKLDSKTEIDVPVVMTVAW